MAKGDYRDVFMFEPVGAHNDGLDISGVVTITIPTGATKILMQVQTQNARYTLDGTNPSATKGFQLKAVDPERLITFGNGTVLKIIEEAATADLQYQMLKG